MTARFIVADVFDGLATIEDGSVDLVVCSPPFLALRSYLPPDHPEKSKEIGSESTPAEFIDVMLRVTAELRRVLAPHGSICVELGDTYAGSGGGGGDYLENGWREGQQQFAGSAASMRESNTAHWRQKNQDKDAWPLAKSRTLIPQLYEIALAYGINPLTGQPSPAGQWRIRNVVSWCLDGDTVVYARTPKGEGPVRLLHLTQNFQYGQWELWDGTRWTHVLGWSNTEADDAIEIEFRNGEIVSATRNHEWPTQRGLVSTEELRVGDVVDTVRLPEPDRIGPDLLPDTEIGWFVGTFLADGSFDSRDRIQIAGHIDETAVRLPRLQRLAKAYDGSATAHHYENTASIVVRSPVLSAVLRRYLAGDSARNKTLRAAAWRRSNQFLDALLAGYLDGDGHWDAKNDRWRLGFTDNRWLARDLRVIAARLGYRCRIKRHPRAADPRGGRFAGTARFYHRGEIRFETRRDFAPTGQVVALRASKRRRFFDVGVEGEPHLFALGSGILTHNCRPNPPVGALGDKWRPATSDLIVACTSPRRYWDDLATRKPISEWTKRYADGFPVSERAANDPVERLGINPTAAGGLSQQGAPLLDYWEIPPGGYKGSHYACVDADTEALTLEGWKRHDQLRNGDLIAAYDAWRGVLRWELATFHRYDFDGDLVSVNQRETVQRLTPNHRVLHRTRSSDEPRVIEASDLKASHRLPVAAPFEGYLQDGPGEKMMALLGWFITEGNMRKQSRQAFIYQSMSANPEKCAQIRGLLDALGADYDERHRERTYKDRPHVEATFVVNGELAAWLRSMGKIIPGWVLGVSEPELQSFFDALIDGDGHRRGERRSFVSNDERNADMFQAVAARLGFRSTIIQRKVGTYEVTVGERSWLSLRGTNGRPKGIDREHYQGIVWCPSVPSSFWLARRSGRPFITGNTFPEELVVPCVKAMCPPKVCRVCGEPSRRIVDSERDTSLRPGRSTHDSSAKPGNGLVASHGETAYLTAGFTDCGHDDYRPGIVLDPFAGSGTTLAVATGHGYDAIGIDLDERNADLAEQRVGGFFFEREELVR